MRAARYRARLTARFWAARVLPAQRRHQHRRLNETPPPLLSNNNQIIRTANINFLPVRQTGLLRQAAIVAGWSPPAGCLPALIGSANNPLQKWNLFQARPIEWAAYWRPSKGLDLVRFRRPSGLPLCSKPTGSQQVFVAALIEQQGGRAADH